MKNKIIPCDETNEPINIENIDICGTCSSIGIKNEMIKYDDYYFCKEENLECLAEYLGIDNEALKIISENYKKEK